MYVFIKNKASIFVLYCLFTEYLMKKFLLPILLFVQILLVKILSYFPDVVEKYYSNGLYPIIAKSSRTIFGLVRFSVGDILYFIVIFLLLRWLWFSRKTWREEWKNNLLRVLSFLSVFYFLFHMLWALNYHRVKLSDKMNIATEYSDEQLLIFTKRLIVKTNELQLKITSDNLQKVQIRLTQDQIFKMNLNGYEKIAKQYTYFNYDHLSIKRSLISLPLSYMGFSGYLNPFTNEAQVNDLVPMYSFPATSCHEMAHQLGYASESEANFIGYLAAVHNDDLYIQYSGYTLALRYCLRNWEKRDKIIAKELYKSVNPGIIANFKESRDFWVQYESFIETGFKIFYDNFLKLNKQDDGLDSYSKFVNLVVNYYENRQLD